MENSLRENEERYRLVTELTSDFIFKSIVSPGGQMVLESITQRFTDITGYSPDDIKTADSWQRIANADDRQVLDGFFKAILKGQPNEGKLRIITKSGEVKWIRIFGRPLRDEHKRCIVGIIGAGKDITEYVRAEEERKRLQGELVEKERFLEAVLQQMPVGIIVAETPGGKLYLYNKKVAELLRHPFYPTSAVEQYVQYKGFHPDGRPYKPEEWPLARSVKTGEVVEGEEIDYLRGDGSHCWIKVYSGPIRNEKGQITGAIVSFFDVTERKQALERVEKLNTLLISLRKINEALVRSKDEVALFHVICDSLTGVGFVRFTWIGLFEEGSNDIKPIAHAGFEDGFLSSVTLRWDDAGYAASPAGIAVNTGKPYILINIAKDQMNEAWRKEALKRGYKACVALPLKYDEKSIGVFVVFSGTKEAIFEEEIGYLQEVATDISVGIKSRRLERGLQQSYERIRKTLKGTIDAIANICEKRDPYTSGHEKRVAQLACAIAGEMGLSEDQVEGIRVTSCLHDIGKMEVPAEILSKPTKLSEIEFSLIKAHAQTGYEILKGVEFPWPVAQIVLQHQERLDGSGYPNGLKGKEIMLEARILAVADTIEAMSSHRPYRPAMGVDMALKEITRKKGILYDPAAVDACLKLFRRKGFRFR
ncbi:MAG: PAS domain S-box protein [Candidatus Brocadiaceae bacterium]|nr:PAS domain S-box protein [Candidatus Brocadiaceae bacterium]